MASGRKKVTKKVTEAPHSPECDIGRVPNHWLSLERISMHCSCRVTLDFSVNVIVAVKYDDTEVMCPTIRNKLVNIGSPCHSLHLHAW